MNEGKVKTDVSQIPPVEMNILIRLRIKDKV